MARLARRLKIDEGMAVRLVGAFVAAGGLSVLLSLLGATA